MAWLSWRSEQETVANLVGQLQDEIGDRIEQKLTFYLETPHLINKINADALKQGFFKPQGQASETYLWRQIQNFPSVSWIYYGGEKAGEFIGITRLDKRQSPERSLQLAVNMNGFQRYYYNLDQQGNRVETKRKPEFYDARQRPWYRSAIKTNQPSWSPIYPDSTLPDQVITATLPIYNTQNERIGVLGADFSLENICQFLQELQIGKSGQAFILEPSGLLVASSKSHPEQAIANQSSPKSRMLVKNSSQPMIRDAANYLEQQVGSLEKINTEQNLNFWSEGKHVFLKVLPYRDQRGLNWLIAVAMPESDFTEQIDVKRKTTILLTCLALGSAIALGLFTTQYINKSLRRLTLASQALANGELEREVPTTKIKELDLLSQAFNQMATQLKQSFAELENANEGLERRIQERTLDLQTSQEKFRSLISNLTGILYRCSCDRDWTMEFLGGAVTEITGYQPQDFIGNTKRTWASIIHPEDREMVERVVDEALICRHPYIIEFRIIDAQGNIHWLYEKGQGVFSNDQLLWLDGAIFDISDRKQVESQLLERVHLSILMAEIGAASTQMITLEEVIQSYVESLWRHMQVAFAHIWTINVRGDALEIQASAGQFNQIDSNRLRLLIPSDKILAIIKGSLQPLLTEIIFDELTEADQVWLQNEGIVSIVGFPLMLKDRGIGVMLLISQSHLRMDIQIIESVANAIAIGIDRKQSEEKLKTTNAEMTALFAAMDEVILVRDRLGRIIKIPQTRRELVSWLIPEEVLGKLPSEIYPPEYVELLTTHIQKVLDTQQTSHIEYALPSSRGNDQHLLWWDASISPIDQDTVIWVATDISDRKKTEQQLKQAKQIAEDASHAKGQFLANMSHELRTPLNAILGFTQLMARDTGLRDSHRSYLRIIYDSGEHLLELINDVLDMSKIESGRISLNLNSFDLYHLLDTLEKMFRLKANSKSLQLTFKRSRETPQWINTDEGKLRQILINLLSNAIKFTNVGSITLSVEVLDPRDSFLELANLENLANNDLEPPPMDSPIFLRLAIADTGDGIPSHLLEKIFEAFEQTDIGKLASEGTGLGLPISRKFAELLGGAITVTSKLGNGSVFRLLLPIHIPPSSTIAERSPERYVMGLAPNQSEYRLLVVEDRWESRHLLVKLLEAVGFQVREAENGAQAIAIWEEWQPHLIWMDMRMPVMDGYEATRQIKSHLKGQATVIIALTASALEEEKAIILSAGCDDFVRKPFRESLILDKLAEYLGVIYLYETETDRTKNESDDLAILESNLQAHLCHMSDSWNARLYQAATLADNELIADLIKEIPINNTVLIQSLVSLVDNFCYTQLMNLTQQALEN
nr:cache domain-containing protein [Pseudanabaena sp. FACHB-1998]